MAKRNYTHHERVSALATLAANGGNVTRTAESLGIPRVTLSQWAHGTRRPEVLETAEATKEALRDLLERAARVLIGVALDKAEELSGKDAMIAVGIAVDKMQLLAGRPTAINQHDLI